MRVSIKQGSTEEMGFVTVVREETEDDCDTRLTWFQHTPLITGIIWNDELQAVHAREMRDHLHGVGALLLYKAA